MPSSFTSTTHASQDTLTPSIPRYLRNGLLSWFIPVGFAMDISEWWQGPSSEKGVFKLYIQELQNLLIIKGSSTELMGKLIPRYLNEVLRHKMNTGELLEFGDQIEYHLTKAYDSKLDEGTRNQYKELVFKKIMSKLGPHGVKFIQTMRPKNPDSWIARVIGTSQTDLPAPSVEVFENMLKAAFAAQGSMDYVEHFKDYIKVQGIVGAGTVGIAAAIHWNSSAPSNEEKEKDLIAKILRPGIIPAILKDHECFNRAIDTLLAQNEITEDEARTCKSLSKRMQLSELREINPSLENAHLAQNHYQAKGISTVEGDTVMHGLAKDVVFMQRAKGIELSKYLQNLRTALVQATSLSDKNHYLEKLVRVRESYVELMKLHFDKISKNQFFHADLHPGNLFYDEETNQLSVLDLGSMTPSFSTESHQQLNHFLFAFNLSLGTADIQYLRIYYQKEIDKNACKLPMTKIEPLLKDLQNKLDDVRARSQDKKVIEVDQAAEQLTSSIIQAVLTIGEDIVPTALLSIAKANKPLEDEFEALQADLKKYSYPEKIPLRERTLFAIALNNFLNLGDSAARKALWTPEYWEYFSKSILNSTEGFSRLSYEKKFIYGILGLTDQEASQADFLCTSTIISAPVAVYIAGSALKKTTQYVCKAIPDMIELREFTRNLQSIFKSQQISTRQGLNNIKEFLSVYRDQYEQWKLHRQTTPLPSKERLSIKPIVPKPPIVASGLLNKNKFFSRGVVMASVAVAGGALLGYKLYENRLHQTPKSSENEGYTKSLGGPDFLG